jgi:NAD(P)-dependent dehydrogenase (short-subunit alcohol dehydrogenase family)
VNFTHNAIAFLRPTQNRFLTYPEIEGREAFQASNRETDMGDIFNAFNFYGKAALVTGAASGMGLATAKAFADAGAAVVLVDINQEAVRAVATELAAAGHKAIAIACDVTDEGQVKSMVKEAVSAFGRLDAAFNNAGVQSLAVETADATVEEFDRVNAINLRSVWLCMKHELLQMRAQGSGAIVNNSSIGGLIGIPGRAIYHATKHGVIGLTKSAALEYAAKGININAICPGAVETPMVAAAMIAKEPETMKDITREQPIGRLGRPEQPWCELCRRARARRRWRLHGALREVYFEELVK